ncbi:MAG: SulP family inorganic anion transporter [Gammaproteobacteria bacterium]
MGYTRISGTPVITGLYTILIPMVLFAVFGSSRHLVVGADSATAAILAAALAGVAATGSEEYVALAAVLDFMAAGFLALAHHAGDERRPGRTRTAHLPVHPQHVLCECSVTLGGSHRTR